MKILHVCKKYLPVVGGDAVVVGNLQKQQAPNHTVVIVTSNCAEITSTSHLYKIGLKDTSAGLDNITIKRIVSLFMLGMRMFAILYKERPDVIHAHSVDMAFFVSFAARLFTVPIVHTFHIVTFYDPNQSALRRKTELWLIKKAKPRFITAPNTFDVEQLRSAGLHQTVLMPNGVDVTFWKRSTSPTSKIFSFLAIGRLERQKGYEYLLEAVALLAKEPVGSFKVTIIGEGSQKKYLQKFAKTLHIDKHVTFVGSKEPAEVKALLANADAMVCASLYETTPLTLLEAWSAAVPVITTPVGILHDEPAGFAAAFVVPLKDEQGLMQAMGTCMTNKVSRMMVAAMGHKEAKKYAWPVINQSAEALYGEAL